MGSVRRFLTGLFLIVTFTAVLLPNEESACSYPPEGSWIVTDTESYYGEVIVLNGDLIVEAGGSLTFRNVTLKMNCAYNGEFSIFVRRGGEFHVLEDSVIAPVDLENRISQFVVEGTLRMNSSELHGCGWADAEGAWGLEVYSDDAVIENSLISHNFRVNIRGEGVVVRGNNITENDHHGIFLWECSPTICGNHISRNGVNGIELHSGSPTICNNTILLNDVGVICGDRSNPVIKDNVIAYNRDTGIAVGAESDCSPIIQGNEIFSNNGWAGIVVKGKDIQAIIQGNVIANNSRDGIHTGGDIDLLVQGNIIASNGQDGILCQDGIQAEIHRNDIHGNARDIGSEGNPSIWVNATHNYWGGTPKEDKISQNVLYDPWLTESISPSVEITSPLSGETVSRVTVSAEVTAPNGVQKAVFYVDGQLQCEDYDVPYEWDWDAAQCADAEYEVTTKVHDMFGLEAAASVRVSVDSTPPTVTISEPRAGNVYAGIMRVRVNAADNLELGNVRLTLDGSESFEMSYDPSDGLWKYDLDATAFPDGQHALMVLVLDRAGNPASASVSVFSDSSPPELTIESPQSGITVGEMQTVRAQANDVSGILRVEFYLDDVLVYTGTHAPYEWSWDTRRYPNGDYTVAVKAFDTLGNVLTKEAAVAVRNIEAPWWQT